MANTNITGFTFRNKFKNLLNELNIQEKDVTTAFSNFLRFLPEDAAEFLWHMSSATDTSSFFTTLGLLEGSIPQERLSLLLNELRYQYKLLHPDFLSVDLPAESKEAFTALEKALSSPNSPDSSIAAYAIYQHCLSKVCFDQEYIAKLLHILNSKYENNFYGGLIELGFYHERAYLKPFCKQIAVLLSSLYDYRQKELNQGSASPFSALASIVDDLPFTMSSEEDTPTGDTLSGDAQAEDTQTEAGTDIQEAEEHADEESAPEESHSLIEVAAISAPAECAVTSAPVHKPIMAKEILAHQDAFEEYLHAVSQLSSLGFDIKEVTAKTDDIRNLIAASEALVA